MESETTAGVEEGPEHGQPDVPVGSRSRSRAILGNVLLGAMGVLCVLPIYWMYATSLRAPGDVLSLSPLPWPMSVENYTDAWHKIPIGRMLWNTFAVALVTALGQLLTGLFAAYAFAVWEFRAKQFLYLLFVGTWLVPFQVAMLPNYVLLFQLGVLNTIAGVIVPSLCSALSVLMLRQHLRSFPKELLDAAKMDGRSSWATLWTVVVPNLRPALAALGILLFVQAWNEYFWPALVLQRTNAMVQLGIRSFMGTEGNDWGPLMATAGLACLPVFAIYLVLQRQVVNAFVRSGLK
ncbi:carbohydrate ABC transporter permease [Saccharopolyspora indica]|uniref:carbohydrate ABC transporter permease n=1 Tax=Saccharopolyspora indica TaxID=1229659 RepID=UPI0022EB7449|nr:carbohydrate ABC transporter permease [Saccharopolyspora indica]MDA3648396.1 carbohydrate ABC transporter permease [Saccharopolyspora indica]